MTDIVTYCDVNTCEDCPRYADDCDGDKYLDRYPTMHEYAEGKRINPKLTDLISRADAIEAVCEECSERWKHYKECDLYKDGQCFEITALMALPSAEADRPKVIGVDYSPYRIQTTAVQAYDIIAPNKIYCSPQLAENVEVVVRCKDCKNWTNGRCWGITFCGDDASYIETEETDFCSYGERREP